MQNKKSGNIVFQTESAAFCRGSFFEKYIDKRYIPWYTIYVELLCKEANMDKELIKGSTAVLVLTLLSEKDMYGYEIIGEMKKRSDNIFSMKEGSLYPMLHSLEKNDAVESYWVDTPEGRRRKYYRITAEGKKTLEVKRREWNVFSKLMNCIVNGGEREMCYE